MLSLFSQADGVAGVRQTLSKIAELANASILDPVIRDQAAYAIAGCQKGDRKCQCASLLIWVNRSVQYVPDPSGVELVHDPRLMARAIAERKRVYGDCDDMSGYLAALLKSIGIRPILRAVGYLHRPLSHVYVVAERMNLDPTRDAWSTQFRAYPETDALEWKV
jgi:hypothetical protein